MKYVDKSLNDIKSSVDSNKKALESLNRKLRELEANHIVQEYINLKSEYDSIQGTLLKCECELAEAKMNSCSHIFVCVSKGKNDGHKLKNDLVFYCVKCGVTNYYQATSQDSITIFQRRIGEIYNRTSNRGYRIGGIHEDLDFAKNEYERLKNDNPDVEAIELASILKESISVHEGKSKEK